MTDPTFEARRANEERIIKRVIADALRDTKIALSVEEEQPTRDPEALYAEIVAVDEARLYFWRQGENTAFGWVLFVLGNDQGENVLSDYTTNLDAYLAGANQVIHAVWCSITH